MSWPIQCLKLQEDFWNSTYWNSNCWLLFLTISTMFMISLEIIFTMISSNDRMQEFGIRIFNNFKKKKFSNVPLLTYKYFFTLPLTLMIKPERSGQKLLNGHFWGFIQLATKYNQNNYTRVNISFVENS